jgi:hypothetical protein
MPFFRYLELPANYVTSVAWVGDQLVDRLGGHDRYGLDGSVASGGIAYGYRFDAIENSPSGDYTVLYERRGTKGIVLRGFKILREINRSYYQASSFDFPITLLRLPDGREAIAHCPDHYARIEIDLLEGGERLTARPINAPEPDDFFHSGLATDPSGTWLMSAGWVWHPFGLARFWRLVEALEDPTRLDHAARQSGSSEVTAAAFLSETRVAMASSPDANDFTEDDDPDAKLRPGTLGVYDPGAANWEHIVPVAGPTGRLLTVDEDHLLALYESPRLIRVSTGETVERWQQISTGDWNYCYGRTLAKEPAFAWDSVGRRLAVVAAHDKIQVLVPNT